MKNIQARDFPVDTARGRLHARRWEVPDNESLPPIVLFHDSLGSVELWRDFPEKLALATQRRVLAYDRLGFGKSDAYPGDIEPSFILDEALTGFSALRDQAGIDRFIAFGHSVGGCMAAATAAQFPQHCVALITESAQAYVEDRTRKGILEAKRQFAQPGQMERLQKYHGDKAAWVLGAWVNTWLSPGFTHWNLDEPLKRVRCPLLALHGENDEYGTPSHPQRIAELAGGPSTVKIFAGCGHVPHREMSDAVLSAVTQWLALLRAN